MVVHHGVPGVDTRHPLQFSQKARLMAKKQSSVKGIPVIEPLLNLIIGSRNERFVKKYTMRVNAINALEPKVRALTDTQLRAKVTEFRERTDKGEQAIDLLVETFAVAREAMDRAVGIRNIFNPDRAFDPGQLAAPMRDLYAATKAKMDSTPTLLPRSLDQEKHRQTIANFQAKPEGFKIDTDDVVLGHPDPFPGWMQVEIPNELYEAVRALYPESRPPFRARPFDVQLIGAMVLSQGKIAEMKTGEGKTIVAPLATFLATVERNKVHVVTVNDYLVQRDRDWTFPFFHALGLTVGAIHPSHMQSEDLKRQMYRCDVVYGTTSEFGFDYLRDNMKRTEEQQVQKQRQFAIVDEVDSILIDEARTPLIISGPAHEGNPRYELADRLARHLQEKQRPWQQADDRVQECLRLIKGLEGDMRTAKDKDKIPALEAQHRDARANLPKLEAERVRHVQFYEVELERKQAHLTHQGIAEAQRAAGVGSFYVGDNIDLPHLLAQSIRAHSVYERDRDYIVAPTENPATGRMEPSIVIVDTFTGRPMIGRQWSDGLHQACETKEGVPIRAETQTVATVTIQNFFKMYKRLSGMTGTADTEAQEFHDIYALDVVAIPTNKPVTRRDYDDLMFLIGKDKWNAIVDEIKTFHDVGRPILVGTTSVEKSETLAKMLQNKHGIKHEVLNAKQHEREAHIVENAGHLGQVMIATNMAGRGTDIKLGKVDRATLLDHWLRRSLCSRELKIDATDAQVRENVFRKIAPQHIEIQKREADEMPFAELERRLMEHWTLTHTWLSPGKIKGMSIDDMAKSLDDHGRFLLHRIRWFSTIEDMGGLHVIGTERHESRRIDNQLRGRSGRQGDKGSSRFFVSIEDDLMKLFAGKKVMSLLAFLGLKEGDAIEHPRLSKAVEGAQRKVEERNFQIRKNILEYDEVMEHQRRSFYSLRQRVLEGRDVKGLIFEYISASTADAVGMYLSKDYASDCAAEYARQTLDFMIQPDRLKGRDTSEMIKRIREDAKQEARAMIHVTIGEYMPHADVATDADAQKSAVDFDAAGLVSWAKSHFGVDLNLVELVEAGPTKRKEIENRLAVAAEERIDTTDLSGIERYTVDQFGPQELCKWVENKLVFKLTVDEINKARSNGGDEAVVDLIMKQTRELYDKREVEYPVDFAMDMAMAVARQAGFPAAADRMIGWANQRYALGWTVDKLKSTPPQEMRRQLVQASEAFVASGKLEKEIEQALACSTRETLAAHFKERFNVTLPDDVLRKTGEERSDSIRARVESLLRSELVYFERTMLLDILDPSWKDHLYSMDQLKDTINYRAFSQQDPRIEYKKEGSKMFNTMLEGVRDRVSDFVFKYKLTPQVQAAPGGASPAGSRPAPRNDGLYVPPSRPAPTAASRPAPAAAPAPPTGDNSGPAAGIITAGGMGIAGPGLETLYSPKQPNASSSPDDPDEEGRANA